MHKTDLQKPHFFFLLLSTNKIFTSKYQAAAWGKYSKFQQTLEDPEVRVNIIPTLLAKMWGFLNYLICLLTYPTGKVGLRQLSRKDSVMYSPSIIKTLNQCILLPTLGQGLENVLSLLQIPSTEAAVLFIPWRFLSLRIPSLRKLLIFSIWCAVTHKVFQSAVCLHDFYGGNHWFFFSL